MVLDVSNSNPFTDIDGADGAFSAPDAEVTGLQPETGIPLTHSAQSTNKHRIFVDRDRMLRHGARAIQQSAHSAGADHPGAIAPVGSLKRSVQ
jgi:hypothetical protein